MRRLVCAIALIVATAVLRLGTAQADEPFAAGNCAVTRQATELKDTDGKVTGPKLPAASYLKILSARAGFVEVAWIPSWLQGCEQEGGVFAGWVRRGDMAREYKKSGGNRYDSVQPAVVAPIFDEPDGTAIGRVARNANLWVIARRGDWVFVTTETGQFAPKDESWRQPRGWVAIDALEPFVLADPTGPAGRGGSAQVRFSSDSDDLEIHGRHFTWRDVCPEGESHTTVFLTSIAASPVALFCGDSMDGGADSVSIIPLDGKPRSKRLRRGSSAISDSTLVKTLKALLKPGAK